MNTSIENIVCVHSLIKREFLDNSRCGWRPLHSSMITLVRSPLSDFKQSCCSIQSIHFVNRSCEWSQGAGASHINPWRVSQFFSLSWHPKTDKHKLYTHSCLWAIQVPNYRLHADTGNRKSRWIGLMCSVNLDLWLSRVELYLDGIRWLKTCKTASVQQLTATLNILCYCVFGGVFELHMCGGN